MKKIHFLIIATFAFFFFFANETNSFVLKKNADFFYVSKIDFSNTHKVRLFNSNTSISDTITPIKMGTIELSDEFKPFLNVDKNSGINIFRFEAPQKGNIIINGFVSAGTYGKMLYTRLIKNGKIISEKTCGIGSPLYNGPFNFQTLVNKGDKLSIEIIVRDHKWQLHCCPDLYNCTFILSKQ